MTHQDTLWVELLRCRYPIELFRSEPTAEVNPHPLTTKVQALLESASKILVLVDTNVAANADHRAMIEQLQTLDRVVVYVFEQAGESLKTIEHLEKVYEICAESGIDRKGMLIAMGGGVIGDLAGFAAATWLRGVAYVQIPTTLLAMVDSAVGGKTGINISAGKNLVGAFHQPLKVITDARFLDTLPLREFRAGMAEVIKYGLLGDSELFELLETKETLQPDHPSLPWVVSRCCADKAAIVAVDEKEMSAQGGRALLNLGHTFAHAIEKVAGFGDYLHGEAVSIGLVAASQLSVRLGMLDTTSAQRIPPLLARYGLFCALRHPLSLEELMKAMQRDKKTSAGKLNFILLNEIGAATRTSDVPIESVQEIWKEVGAVET